MSAKPARLWPALSRRGGCHFKKPSGRGAASPTATRGVWPHWARPGQRAGLSEQATRRRALVFARGRSFARRRKPTHRRRLPGWMARPGQRAGLSEQATRRPEIPRILAGRWRIQTGGLACPSADAGRRRRKRPGSIDLFWCRSSGSPFRFRPRRRRRPARWRGRRRRAGPRLRPRLPFGGSSALPRAPAFAIRRPAGGALPRLARDPDDQRE